VTQSDLTFATNPRVIIGEVQQKLLALGLVSTGQGLLDAATLDTVAESINFLNSNDIAENDLNINGSAQDSASVVQEMNISDFLGSLPGGEKFKQNSKSTTAKYAANAQDQVKNQKDGGTATNPTR
jgi:phosphoribosylformylglycinamidine (FGAM) synthase-like amidotransferase family enzyme